MISLTNAIEQKEGLAAEGKLIRGCPKASAYLRALYQDQEIAHHQTIRDAVALGEITCSSYEPGKGLLASRYVFRTRDLEEWADAKYNLGERDKR